MSLSQDVADALYAETHRLRGGLEAVKAQLLQLAAGPLSLELLTMASIVDEALRPREEGEGETTAAVKVARACPRRCFCCFRRCTGDHTDGGCHVGADRHFVAFENLTDAEAEAARVAVALLRHPVSRKVLGE